MKTVTLTQARNKLGELVQQGEPVELTRRGQSIATLRVFAKPKVDREAAIKAAHDIRELSARLAAKRKPSKRHGATKAVRDLRDDGR